MKSYLVRFALIPMMAFLAPAWAEDGPADAELPVANCQTTTINAALPQALSSVLIRMSGNPDLMTLPSVQAQVSEPARFVTSYQCVANSQASDQPWLAQIHFDAHALKKLLKAGDQAALGTTQTQVAVYVSGVNNLSDYSAVLGEFKKIAAVSHVSVAAIDQDHLILQVAVAGGSQALQTDLVNSPQFSAQAVGSDADLSYRYNLG